MGWFIPAYVAAIALTALTVGLAVSLGRASGQRIHQVFLFVVIANDLVCLSEILFRFLPARLGPSISGGFPAVTGFLSFPLMAAFSYLVLDWLLAVYGIPVPRRLKQACAIYWALLFIGFLAAELLHIEYRDLRLARILKPFFNVAIIASGLGAALFVQWRARAAGDLQERRFLRVLSAYVGAAIAVFGTLFFAERGTGPAWAIAMRSFLGLAWLLPPWFWMRRRFRETQAASLATLAGDAELLGRWLETSSLSPREQQIVRCVIEGKSNAAIGEQLFIGLRTVESHLYSIYRKLGVKNRLQLARLAAVESGRAERPGKRVART